MFWEALEKPSRFRIWDRLDCGFRPPASPERLATRLPCKARAGRDFGFWIFKGYNFYSKYTHIEILNFGHWNLFVICDLLIGTSISPALHD
jgi:hypothetical protein